MQSERYFSPVKNNIITRFGGSSIKEFGMDNSICVHIRRGDYLDDKHRDILYVCSDDYYKKAINKMEELQDSCKYFVFSDDIEWVKNHLLFLSEKNTIFVYNDEADSVIKDFEIMKSCHHFIISNSTLSWWAQYLGHYDDKIVIAPSRWGNKRGFNQGIYMDNWLLIQV